MSNAGLGAFVQGLAQGYQIGDKMQTAEQEREFRGLQINKAKRDLQVQGEIDTARSTLVAASKNLIADQSDDNVAKWRQASIDYTALAAPDKLSEVQKVFKNEDIEKTGRVAAGVIRDLLSGAPNAITDASKLNGFVPNGVEIDPNNSVRNSDGSYKFSFIKTGTNEPAGERVVTPQQIVTMGLGFVANPDKSFELTAKLFDSSLDRDVKLYGINTEAKTANRRTDVAAEGNRLTRELRADAQANTVATNDRDLLKGMRAMEINNLDKDINIKTDDKLKAQKTAEADEKYNIAETLLLANHNFKLRPPAGYIYNNALKLKEELKKPDAFVKDVPPYLEGTGYGMTIYGFAAPLPAGARMVPKQ